MTITLTVEETRDYQTRVDGWVKSRLEVAAEFFAENWCSTVQPHESTRDIRRDIATRYEKTMAEWEKENPQPKLIPFV